MPNFTYKRDIPHSTHNPSVDQPDMEVNNNSIDSLIQIDHYGFNDNLGGYHKIIHLPPQVSDPAPVAGTGQIYTKTVAGDQELYYESGNGVIGKISNPSSIDPVVAVNFSVAPGPGFAVTINNSFNVASVVRELVGQYLITFTNVLPSANYYVSLSAVGRGTYIAPIGGSMTTTVLRVNSYNTSNGVLADVTTFTVSVLL